MKPGDLVSFTCHTGVPFEFQTDIGIFLSVRTTKWDRKVVLHKFFTSSGLREVVLGTKGTRWKVLNETG